MFLWYEDIYYKPERVRMIFECDICHRHTVAVEARSEDAFCDLKLEMSYQVAETIKKTGWHLEGDNDYVELVCPDCHCSRDKQPL